MQQMMGLESRRGALQQLGEEFPDEKLAEIRDELMEDALADGAMQLLQASIAAEIFELTGIMPGQDGEMTQQQTADQTESTKESTTAAGGKSVENKTTTPVPVGPRTPIDPAALQQMQGEQNLRTKLVTQAYGTKIPLRRMPGQNGS